MPATTTPSPHETPGVVSLAFPCRSLYRTASVSLLSRLSPLQTTSQTLSSPLSAPLSPLPSPRCSINSAMPRPGLPPCLPLAGTVKILVCRLF